MDSVEPLNPAGGARRDPKSEPQQGARSAGDKRLAVDLGAQQTAELSVRQRNQADTRDESTTHGRNPDRHPAFEPELQFSAASPVGQ